MTQEILIFIISGIIGGAACFFFGFKYGAEVTTRWMMDKMEQELGVEQCHRVGKALLKDRVP